MSQDALYWRVAELHLSGIDQGFLATLGLGFLAEMYRAIDESQSSVLLVAWEGDRVVGFVAGGSGMGPIYRRMLRRWPKLVTALLPALLSPPRLWRILEILRYSRIRSQSGESVQAELLAIAVDASFRGNGHADGLYHDLCAYFQKQGVSAFTIVVGAALTPAHRFYTRMGAYPVAELEVHGGEKSTVYVQRLRIPEEAAADGGAVEAQIRSIASRMASAATPVP